jgi:hypothetical protein
MWKIYTIKIKLFMVFMRNYIVRREGFAGIVLRKLASIAGRRRHSEKYKQTTAIWIKVAQKVLFIKSLFLYVVAQFRLHILPTALQRDRRSNKFKILQRNNSGWELSSCMLVITFKLCISSLIYALDGKHSP